MITKNNMLNPKIHCKSKSTIQLQQYWLLSRVFDAYSVVVVVVIIIRYTIPNNRDWQEKMVTEIFVLQNTP